MSKLFSRALRAHTIQTEQAAASDLAHAESKRLEILRVTRFAAFEMLDALLDDEEIHLVPCRHSHPNVYAAATFTFEGFKFHFLPFALSWSVIDFDGNSHSFKDLASLGEALKHPAFARLTCPARENDDE